MEGAAHILATQPHEQIEDYLDQLISKFAAAQQDDGYLNTYYTLAEPDQRWSNRPVMHEFTVLDICLKPPLPTSSLQVSATYWTLQLNLLTISMVSLVRENVLAYPATRRLNWPWSNCTKCPEKNDT